MKYLLRPLTRKMIDQLKAIETYEVLALTLVVIVNKHYNNLKLFAILNIMKIHLLFIFLFPLFTQISLAQGKKEKFEEIMKSYHQFNMFDGSILVAENGKVIYKGAFGMANHEWNIPNTTDTKFMLGSVSKPITAILMLIQVQKGLINLDKTIPTISLNSQKKMVAVSRYASF